MAVPDMHKVTLYERCVCCGVRGEGSLFTHPQNEHAAKTRTVSYNLLDRFLCDYTATLSELPLRNTAGRKMML
jgi:hypothetical protein